ncbi:MAG: UDP-N-acetylmuramate dehydrogenase [Coriobacteriia bacterium]|nr:UDP-N-acetylmuramate dehydrogenase [Coriobacteriia bacterium]
MKVSTNTPVSALTTMRLGGDARYCITITTPSDLADAYAFAADKGLPTYILGGGSNVVGRDGGFDGVIMLNQLKSITAVSETSDQLLLRVGSGEDLDALVHFTVARDWCGIEALAAIPGTVGGAIMQNAGAYGQEIAQVLLGVDVYDTQTGEHVHLPTDDLALCYRRSIFNSDGPDSAKGRYFITAALLNLHKNELAGDLYGSLQDYLDKNDISDRRPQTICAAVTVIRGEKLPDPATTASSGSFFKNITIDQADIEPLRTQYPGIPIFLIGNCWEIASGWLIEQVGLKGQLIDGMRVSDKAALILINESAAGYDDLARARETIVAAVKERFGFTLQQEPEEL